MTQFQKKSATLIYVGILAALLAVLSADVLTPLGVAVWVIYLLPVALALFLWRPSAPLYVSLLSTGFLIAGFFLSPRGLNPTVAIINRGFGFLTIWTVGLISAQTIRSKLLVRQQEWLQTGHAKLNDRMRGEQSNVQLSENVLRFVAEYLDATAAVFYVENGAEFALSASYAVSDLAAIPSRITPGQGLIGQAVKDGRAFVVRDVPHDYLSFGSALGKSTVKHLIIAPVMADGAINGVLEFGFARDSIASDIEFFRLIGESVGVALRSSRYRDRLQNLLEETQRQGEELQAQSEELRVNNEELEEQSRALKESQARLELQHAELEQTNTQLEEQTQLLEAQKEDMSRSKSVLEIQSRDLARASQFKSEFVANMSHELRTPLNSSLILAKLLSDNREGNLTAEQVKFAQTIHGAGCDLLALINDILDLSKIEAGRLEMRFADMKLSALVEDLNGQFRMVANQKGLKFQIDVAEDLPAILRSDRQRLEQVLKNLLSNAMKFTEKGGVFLEVKSLAGDRIAFSVRDTGIGVPLEQHEMIFEAFRQADGTTNRKYGGTGLGLSISRELARLLGGEIQLTSEVGHGSTFTVAIPRILNEANAASAEANKHGGTSSETAIISEPPRFTATGRSREISTPGKNPSATSSLNRMDDDRGSLNATQRVILVIEDDENFAKILYDLGHELKFQVLLANTAEEGLSMAAQHVPSAIVLDVGLPDQSGLSVLDRLKRDVRTRHVPVHVVSANDYAETAMALGAVGYLLKPVKRESLVHAFEQLETRLAQRMRRVLIVEDDAVQLESLQHLLQSRDVETVGVRSAGECLERLKSNTFDCMVLDLSLPDASGFSLMETLSQEDRYSFPPVIVYTGRDLQAAEEQKLRRYSKSIIIKGAKSPERLLDEVTLFLHQVVSELPAEQQAMLKKSRNRDAILEGRRILIVEDDVRNVFALTSVLEPHGVVVTIARNGREAIEILDRMSNDAAQAIDLVLMDVMMPEMDGITATKEIRRLPQLAKLPIITITAKAMKNDQQQCLDAGANDYMAKPLDVEQLLSLIRVWIPRS